VVELNLAAPWSHAGLGLAFLVKGKFEEAAVAAQDDAAEGTRLLVVAMARWSQKRIPEADACAGPVNRGLRRYGRRPDRRRLRLPGGQGPGRSNGWSEARLQRDGSLGFMRCDPFLANLHEDPRWDVFLRKMGLADDQIEVSERNFFAELNGATSIRLRWLMP